MVCCVLTARAQVGNIISRVALPTDAAIEAVNAGGEVVAGQSLTSLLRDPALIFKLVILSGLSLLPVLFKVSPTAFQLLELPLKRERLVPLECDHLGSATCRCRQLRCLRALALPFDRRQDAYRTYALDLCGLRRGHQPHPEDNPGSRKCLARSRNDSPGSH